MSLPVFIAAILRGLGVAAGTPTTRLRIDGEALARPMVTDERLIPTHAVTDTEIRPTA